jgi:hypothetical protein
MELILHDVGHDNRDLGHLVPDGIRVVAAQGMAATATGCGLAGDGLANLLRRNQRLLVPGMAGLTAPFLAGLVRRRRRAAFGVKAVGGWGHGRIRRIGAQLGEGVGQLLLQVLAVLLLLLQSGFEIIDFGLQLADSAFHLRDTLLGLSGF